MTKTMTVWRVQHECSKPHGPMQRCPDEPPFSSYNNAPDYGQSLECPSEDPKMKHLWCNEKYEEAQSHVFGTLPEQFPRWWGTGQKDMPENWYAVQYEVPAEDVCVGTNQVSFLPARAKRIMLTQTDFPR